MGLKFVCSFACLLFRAAPAAYEGSQARGPIRAAAAGPRHSHSNMGSEPRLQPTPQITATLWAKPGIEPETSWFLVRSISTAPWWELHFFFFFFFFGFLFVCLLACFLGLGLKLEQTLKCNPERCLKLRERSFSKRGWSWWHQGGRVWGNAERFWGMLRGQKPQLSFSSWTGSEVRQPSGCCGHICLHILVFSWLYPSRPLLEYKLLLGEGLCHIPLCSSFRWSSAQRWWGKLDECPEQQFFLPPHCWDQHPNSRLQNSPFPASLTCSTKELTPSLAPEPDAWLRPRQARQHLLLTTMTGSGMGKGLVQNRGDKRQKQG